jgi:hypothetical protein
MPGVLKARIGGQWVDIMGGLSNYTHTQGTPSATWVIDHELGFNPNITVEDSSGSTVEGEITYNSLTRVTLTFSAAFSGVAYLS